jgi:hypothetical protein
LPETVVWVKVAWEPDALKSAPPKPSLCEPLVVASLALAVELVSVTVPTL